MPSGVPPAITEDHDTMPYRDQATVQGWIQEFRASGHPIATDVSVLEQEVEGSDSGLVLVELRTAETVTYIQPVQRDRPRWVVTFEPREHELELDATGVTELAADLTLLAALCVFLQDKTDALTIGADAT
jgi:hypothetical protein